MTRTPWLTIPLGSATYRVVIADADDPLLVVDGEPCEGTTSHDESIIAIRRTLPPSRMPEVLLHEVLHAVCHISGVSVTQRWSYAREETVVHALAPLLAHALKGAGLWRGRRVPR